jgi:hypothetical protein
MFCCSVVYSFFVVLLFVKIVVFVFHNVGCRFRGESVWLANLVETWTW